MKKRRGDMVIDSTVSLLVVMALLVLAISVFTVINRVSVLNAMGQDMVRYVEIRGSYNASAQAELARLQENNGMDATMSFDGSISGGKIPLGDAFTITLSAKANLGIGGIIKIPIPIRVSMQGRGEKLWK